MSKEIILTESEIKKWEPFVKSDKLPEMSETMEHTLTQLMENVSVENNLTQQMVEESTSIAGGAMPTAPATGAGLNPMLIGVLARAVPTMVGNHWLGTHALTSPNGSIVAQHVYQVAVPNDGSANTETEVWNANRPNVNHSGDGTGVGHAYGTAEDLGTDRGSLDATNGGKVYPLKPWQQMSIKLSTVKVDLTKRALKSHLTNDVIEDLYRMYGVNAKTQLQNILKTQLVAEMDYERFNYVQDQAVVGAAGTTVAGTFDFATDADGRWGEEYWKSFARFIKREAILVGQANRYGMANKIITSPNIAAGLEDLSGFSKDVAIQNTVNTGKFVGMSYSGNWNGFEVYVDPYATTDFVTLVYKGGTEAEAGGFYCPYSFKMYEAKGEEDFNPRIGVQMRYGIVHNPFASGASGANPYFRTFLVDNIDYVAP